MLDWLRRFRLFRLRPTTRPETSRLIVGSTGSGKSEGELQDLVRLAGRGDCAVVLLDGHGPLALRAAGHWAARGPEDRLVYEPLRATDRTLCWSMLPRSRAETLAQRCIDDAETRDEVAQCFLAQRNLVSLNDRPWTKEWLDAAIDLLLSQPYPWPLPSLLSAFRVGSMEYETLLRDSGREEVVAKFRDLERLRRKNEVQYEQQTGASRRLLELVCTSEVVRLRSRPGPFDWLTALRQRKLVAFDGGGLRSREVKRALFLLASMHVIHAVRRHFADTQTPLPVVLVLEEAGALDLVTPFVLTALQELRKAGLAIHLITQSSLDFGDPSLFERIIAHTPWQAWYQVLAPADQELGAKALTNATFDAFAVHYHRRRFLPFGIRPPPAERRATGQEVTEAYYRSPQLQEQEFRTRLATLGVGERFVRDRSGVRQERLKPVRSPWGRSVTLPATRALIDRLRQQPFYLPDAPRVAAPAVSASETATTLRERWDRARPSASGTVPREKPG